ncbi:CRPV-195 [Crowpox virus]|nr:CRPV-195 [Crowpox virus]
MFKNPESINELLDNGSNTNILNNRNYTPLEYIISIRNRFDFNTKRSCKNITSNILLNSFINTNSKKV